MVSKTHKVNIRTLLEKNSLFNCLPDDAFDHICSGISVIEYGKYKTIAGANEPVPGLLVIFSGRVKVFENDLCGNEWIVDTRLEGDICFETSMLDGKPTQAGVSALTRATVGIINKNLFETFIRPYPKAVEQLALTLCGRVRWALSLEYSRIGKSAEQRIAAVLQLLAQRNGTSLPDGRRINASLTQADIASYALTTRESVSRFLSKAGKEGLLKTQNRHIILASSFFKNTFCDSRH